MSEPHIDELNMKKSVCIVSLTQMSLTPIATLYDKGFSGRVQKSARAFNYPGRPCGALRGGTVEPGMNVNFCIFFAFIICAPNKLCIAFILHTE